MLRLAASIVVVILLVPPVSAKPPAEKPRRVALILEPAGKTDAGRVGQLTELLVSAFAKRGIERSRLVSPFDPMALEEGLRILTEVRRDMATDHEMKRAAEHEGKLMRALLGLKSGLGAAGVDALVEVYRGLAATRLADGDRRLAEAYMTAALHLKPGLDDRDFFGRNALRDLFRDIRATATLRKASSVRVQTRPAGAEVYVGDRMVGYSPMQVDGLREGTHLLRVRRDGFYSHGWLADAVPDRSLTLQHDLKPVGGGARFEALRRKLNDKRAWKRDPTAIVQAAEDLKRLFRADDLVVASVRRTKTGYALWGAVAPRGKEPTAFELEVPIDAELLKRVDVLTYEWAP